MFWFTTTVSGPLLPCTRLHPWPNGPVCQNHALTVDTCVGLPLCPNLRVLHQPHLPALRAFCPDALQKMNPEQRRSESVDWDCSVPAEQVLLDLAVRSFAPLPRSPSLGLVACVAVVELSHPLPSPRLPTSDFSWRGALAVSSSECRVLR